MSLPPVLNRHSPFLFQYPKRIMQVYATRSTSTDHDLEGEDDGRMCDVFTDEVEAEEELQRKQQDLQDLHRSMISMGP